MSDIWKPHIQCFYDARLNFPIFYAILSFRPLMIIFFYSSGLRMPKGCVAHLRSSPKHFIVGQPKVELVQEKVGAIGESLDLFLFVEYDIIEVFLGCCGAI
jgi:hypothetical protein